MCPRSLNFIVFPLASYLYIYSFCLLSSYLYWTNPAYSCIYSRSQLKNNLFWTPFFRLKFSSIILYYQYTSYQTRYFTKFVCLPTDYLLFKIQGPGPFLLTFLSLSPIILSVTWRYSIAIPQIHI